MRTVKVKEYKRDVVLKVMYDPIHDKCPLLDIKRKSSIDNKTVYDSWFYPTAFQCRRIAAALIKAADEMEKEK